MVRVELPAAEEMEPGLKEAVAPLGSPLALSVTVWAEPLVRLVVMVLLPLWPAVTATLLGLALIEKSSGAADTASVNEVLWVAEAPVPVTVIVEVPTGVEAEVVTVIVEFPPEEIEAGLKEAVAPAGSPPALRVTVWAEPLVRVVTMVVLPLWPAITAMLPGLALIEKSSGALTLRLSVVVCVAELPVPVTVTV